MSSGGFGATIFATTILKRDGFRICGLADSFEIN